MPAVTSPEHRRKAALIRRLLAAYARSEDLVRIGAYKAGADAELDQALAARPALRNFFMQESGDRVSLAESIARLQALEIGI
jgi:flagellum-specific ATP synthase